MADQHDDSQDRRNNNHHLSQLASVGQVAAGIAHEVRNPLTAVKGFLQLLENEGKKEYIEIAQSELENALTTLNNLLQVSKPDLEEEESQTFLVAVELQSVLNLFQDKIYEVELVVDLKNDDATVYGKKNQFKKAFFNLIKNAFESIPGKGKIEIKQYATEKEIFLEIKDSGIGIPKEKIAILGTPFFSTKNQGTGMGLTQVFSVVYQHGGHIQVESEEGVGTQFTLSLPKSLSTRKRGVVKLDLKYEESYTIKDFVRENRDSFEDRLLAQAINVKDKIEEILEIGNINLLDNAQVLSFYVVEGRENELIQFAKQEGVLWAKYSLTLAFKLEWVQAIRRTLWDFLYNFKLKGNPQMELEDFFTLEKNINELFDQFLNYFFISYSKYKDEQLQSQRKLVESLSVPIIPISPYISILPIIGEMDSYRVQTIEEKVIHEVSRQRIHTLIMDLSGVGLMTTETIEHFMKIIDGISLMGCKTVITGVHPDLVRTIVGSGISFEKKADTKGTLQLALKDYIWVANEANPPKKDKKILN
ncbi:hypothetical protein GCM10008967_39120 [Bacillus carboniphilus]|uniref:histidine kinase n=1 Tax=Bacillus carboniphilus TaxID=86663 RepID=A0ABP3GGG2_9BACI